VLGTILIVFTLFLKVGIFDFVVARRSRPGP